jgi:ubiquinone/menaquinone biosynthesis C-methylase UbiE
MSADAPNPALIFETLNAFQRSSALRGAIELGVFTAIARGHATAQEIAAECSADPRAMRILCDYLTVIGFLSKNDHRYGVTPTAALFLNHESPHYLGGMARFIHSEHLVEAFRDVGALVRRGSTLLAEQGTVTSEYEGWVEFARHMAPMMRGPAQFLGELAVERFAGVDRPLRVLDVAAGHGLFGITVAQRLPQASVVALDWGKVLAVADENARAAQISDRYQLLPGDALQIEYGQDFDLVLLTNFLHHFDRATCIDIMRRASACLRPDGVVFTLEFVPNADRVTPPAAATFSFTMLGTTPAGDAYTFDEYADMWRAVDFQHHTLLDVPQSAQRVIVSKRQ